jgi:hypothetical protein
VIESQLRLLFESGDLKSVTIVKVPLSEDWCLQFARKNGELVLMDSQRISPRRFKTLDAAFAAANGIGFQKVMVVAT